MTRLWIAYQSEPGCDEFELRLSDDSPDRIEPVEHHDMLTGEASGLVYDTSMYSSWRLLGEVDGELVMIDNGALTAVRRPDGAIWEDREIYHAGYYRRVAAIAPAC